MVLSEVLIVPSHWEVTRNCHSSWLCQPMGGGVGHDISTDRNTCVLGRDRRFYPLLNKWVCSIPFTGLLMTWLLLTPFPRKTLWPNYTWVVTLLVVGLMEIHLSCMLMYILYLLGWATYIYLYFFITNITLLHLASLYNLYNDSNSVTDFYLAINPVFKF